MYLNLQIALLPVGRGLGWRKWAGLLSVGHCEQSGCFRSSVG